MTSSLEVAGDFSISVFASGFSGPTQMQFGANGELYIAELNGTENAATGRILRVDADNPTQRTVLQSDLDKPTGIAVIGDWLWIMERQRLSVAGLTPNAERIVVADDLPFNGRSEGTLTLTPRGSLLYNTSGSRRGPTPVVGSGALFEVHDAAQGPEATTTRVVASGFKHAYAHLIDGEGQLWSVEMTDGNYDETRASDELVAVQTGDDAGWPQCVENNRPVVQFGGTAERCADVTSSHALFGVGATPTSLALAPWDPDLFVVALWLPGRVVTVPRSAPTGAPHQPVDLLTGLESPQHLLSDGQQLYISDHETGRIFVMELAG